MPAQVFDRVSTLVMLVCGRAVSENAESKTTKSSLTCSHDTRYVIHMPKHAQSMGAGTCKYTWIDSTDTRKRTKPKFYPPINQKINLSTAKRSTASLRKEVKESLHALHVHQQVHMFLFINTYHIICRWIKVSCLYPTLKPMTDSQGTSFSRH